MAVRPLVINASQSNGGPFHDIASWLPDRVDLNLLISMNRVGGAYAPNFDMPFNAPGYSGTRPIKGQAIRNIRYLNFYNPIVTGYSSYPGTGRVLNLPGLAFAHTAISVWVEQQFIRGTHQVTTVTRKTTGQAHTVAAILTPVMTVGSFNPTPDTITLVAHGGLEGDRLTLTGTLPTGLALATTYYLRYVDADTFQLSLTPTGAVSTFTGTGGTAQVNIVMPPTAGSRLLIDVATPWLAPSPQYEEEFTFDIKASSAAVGVAEAELNLNFGSRRTTTASLKGLQIRHVASGNKRVIDTWDSTTRKASLVNLVGLAPQVWTIAAGDVLVIEPQGGVAWDRYAFFLPWSMFESDLSSAIIDKVNPYMPGFDYPGDFHAPAIYGTDLQTPVGVDGTGGLFRRTIYPYIAWHVGMLVRMSEFYGQEVWCVSCDFGGTSATHVETEIGTANCGWYDKAQQTDWSLGRPNSCFQRLLDELDAAIAAAAAVGDTLQVVCVFRNQGFADGTSASDPTYGDSASQSGISADKFYSANQAFRARLRAEIKARGLWPGEASEIPWVQPLEQQESADLPIIGDAGLLLKVNTAIQHLADADPFAAPRDQTGLITGPDGIHFLGSELAKVENASWDALRSIFAVADRSGEIELCNIALSHIGETAQVTSIDPPDGSAQAAHCAQFYNRARNIAFELHNWGFAMRRRALGAAISSNSSSYAYAYFRPGDAQRVVSVLPPDAEDDYSQPEPLPWQRFSTEPWPARGRVVTQPFEEGILADGTKVLFTDQPEAVVRYVANIRDTRAYPDLFVQALTKVLASLLAGPIIKGAPGAAMSQKLMQEARFASYQASTLSANQRKVSPEHNPPWMSARQ